MVPDQTFMQLYNHLFAKRPLVCPGSVSCLTLRLFGRPYAGLAGIGFGNLLPGDPPAELRHIRIEHRRARPIVHVLSFPPRLDQSCTCELLEMVRDRRLADRKAAAEALTPHLGPLRDVLENLEAARVGQRLRDALKLIGVHLYIVRRGIGI